MYEGQERGILETKWTKCLKKDGIMNCVNYY